MPRELLDPAVARQKERLLSAPYEVCMARAPHFTRVYRETEKAAMFGLPYRYRDVPPPAREQLARARRSLEAAGAMVTG